MGIQSYPFIYKGLYRMSCDFLSLATPGAQGLHTYFPGKPIEEVKREYGIEKVIKLASNENPLGPSPYVQKAIQAAIPGISRYPDGNGFILKKALAEKHNVESSMITLGNGSNDILELIARTFVTSSQSVVYSEYAFAVYQLSTQAIGAQHLVTPAKDWGHDLTAMSRMLQDNTRLIFVANPNNPTGTWVDEQSLKTFLDTVPDNILVTVDEAYLEYMGDYPDYPNTLEWLSDYSNLIVTRTFSKAYGLAGLRVGYAVSHPQIAELMNRVRQPFNVNSLALVAATAALEDKEYLIESAKLNQQGMKQLTHAFDRMGLDYIPSVGNFITVQVGQAMQVYENLLRKGVIVRPVNNYNMPKHLRMSIGTEEENALLIEALQQIL